MEALSTLQDLDSLVQNKSFIKHLMSFHFHNKVILFTLNIMLQFDENIVEA